jgi:hypothetical protein
MAWDLGLTIEPCVQIRRSSLYVFDNHFSLTLIGILPWTFRFAVMLSSKLKAGAMVEDGSSITMLGLESTS